MEEGESEREEAVVVVGFILPGHVIVNVHLIMCPVGPRECHGSSPLFECALIYAQFFDIVPQRNSSVEHTTGLYVLKGPPVLLVLCLAKSFLWIKFNCMLMLFHALVRRQISGLA